MWRERGAAGGDGNGRPKGPPVAAPARAGTAWPDEPRASAPAGWAGSTGFAPARGAADAQAALRSLAAALPACIARVRAGLDEVAPCVLSIGERLQSIAAEAGHLSEDTEQIAACLSGEQGEEGFLAQTRLSTHAVLGGIRLSQERVAESVQRIDAVAARIRRLETHHAGLHSLARQLRMICLGFAIEKARTPAAEQQFAGFTEEMDRLVATMFATIEVYQRNVRAALEEQVSAGRSLASGVAALRQFGDAAHRAVLAAAEGIDRLLREAGALMNDASAHLSEIRQQVGRVIVALQFHDIVRQQLEHLIAAIEEVAEACQIASADAAAPPDEALRHAAAVVRVQIGQLEQVCHTIGDARQDSAEAFATILDEVAALTTRLNGAGAGGHTASASPDALADLLAALQTLASLRQRGLDLHARTGDATRAALEASHRLGEHTDTLADVNDAINLQALNAAVHAARAGEQGQVFSVLATAVMGLASKSAALVAEVVHDLQAIRDSRADAPASEGDDAAPAASPEALAETTAAALADSRRASIQAMGHADAVRKAIATVEKGSAGIEGFAGNTGQTMADLEQVSTLLEPWRAARGEQHEALTALARNYTMASERAAHARALHGDVFLPGVLAICPPTEAEGEFGDNVELF